MATDCVPNQEQLQLVVDLCNVDIALFSVLAFLWIVIVVTIVVRRKVLTLNRRAIILLYVILALIIVSRCIEMVFEREPQDYEVPITICGCIATYSKVALGICQAYAMQ